MSAVTQMHQAGFVLSISGRGGLLVEPASKLTPEQRSFIKQNKVVLLEELRARASALPPLRLGLVELPPEVIAAHPELTPQEVRAGARYWMWRVRLKDGGSATIRETEEPSTFDEMMNYCRSLTGFSVVEPLGQPA